MFDFDPNGPSQWQVVENKRQALNMERQRDDMRLVP